MSPGLARPRLPPPANFRPLPKPAFASPPAWSAAAPKPAGAAGASAGRPRATHCWATHFSLTASSAACTVRASDRPSA